MCGIFGIVAATRVSSGDLYQLAQHAQQRGRDSSGLFVCREGIPRVHRADRPVLRLLRTHRDALGSVAVGHSRLITNGSGDNQPVIRDGVCVFHNGIVVNDHAVWREIGETPQLEIDTEVIAALAVQHLRSGKPIDGLSDAILARCEGVVACAIVVPSIGELFLFSNNGSLFRGLRNGALHFASERFALEQLGCERVSQVFALERVSIPTTERTIEVTDEVLSRKTLIPSIGTSSTPHEKMLESTNPDLRRCTKCVLPHTMPFITFDELGVCNYCRHYRPRNIPRPKQEIFDLVQPYRRREGAECIVPFSGGRDSCYGLHLIVKELRMKPITYTYDWGMVTDLGRRNISRMCAKLGVENIIVAEDIQLKREYIRMNLRAWIKSPHLGMISMLTAGDKHFFRHVETVKRQTGIALNLWGVNPLEVTHFKAGFLGVPPDFEEKRVYSHGMMKQLRYQFLRFRAMLQSPGYFNRSLWDTLSGEYYRSFTKKADYYHIFDYWRWHESEIDATLRSYEWERAPDTTTTWRIGDGTAAFYNYIYYRVAGFSEHDTFRSNQIREGDVSREDALRLVEVENQPRYPNIKWYLDAVGLDFEEVIAVVNAIPRLAGERNEQ